MSLSDQIGAVVTAIGAELKLKADAAQVWTSLTAIPGFVTADLTMTANQYAIVDGTQTVTLSAPVSPAHGDLLGIFVWGSGGTVTFDGNGSSVVLDGNPTFPLLGDGVLTVSQTTWAFDSGQDCWMVVSFGITPEVASLGGAGETGKALMAADDAAGARTALGLAAVATSGSYTDLSDKPAIPTVVTQSAYDALSDKTGIYIVEA